MPIGFRKNILSKTPRSTGPLGRWVTGAGGLYIALLVLLSFAIYWRTLSFGFVADDYFQARHFSLKEIISTFYGTFDQRGICAAFYRPLLVLSYAISYFIFKTNPFGYHLANVFLNAVNVVLVYFIMRKIKANSISSFLAANLFLLMPHNFGPASFISAKAESIMVLFYLSSFLAFIGFYNNQRKALFYWLSILCFIFSLMTREMAVTLPFILLSYSYLRSKRLEIKLAIPHLAILCAYMLFRFLIFKGMGGYAMMFHFYDSIPVHLCLAFLRTHLLFSYTDSYYLLIYLAMFFVLGFLGIVHFKSFENKQKIFFAYSWIAITILPLYRISAFRLLYLPSIGFAMLLSLVCSELHKKNFKYPVIFIMLLSVMLARVNMKNQDLFSPASKFVLEMDKETYVDWHNKLDKEQLTLLEQKLKRYGLFDEAEDFLKRGEKVFNPPKIEEATVSAYVKKLYEQGGLDAILRKHFSIY